MYQQRVAEPEAKVSRPKQSLESWAIDLCECSECRDGFVSKEMKGYSVLFACPMCDRSRRDMAGYTAIPSAKKWEGHVDKYTEVEMYERKKNRREVVDAIKRGAARMPEEIESWANGDEPF
jgi:hypothetical protein